MSDDSHEDDSQESYEEIRRRLRDRILWDYLAFRKRKLPLLDGELPQALLRCEEIAKHKLGALPRRKPRDVA